MTFGIGLTPSLRPLDRDNGQPGLIAPGYSVLGFNAVQALTAGRATVARFVPSRPMTINLIAFVVTTAAGADDACDVGIYDASYSRIVSAGATTGKLNSTGVKTITISPTTLVAGTVYYAAFSVVTPFGGTAASLVMTTTSSGSMFDLFGTTAGLREVTFQSAAHPLAATFTSGGNVSAVPILALRES
jgi:hypothetical protein